MTSFKRNMPVPQVRTMTDTQTVKIASVEPPNWWAGMTNRHLTLMVHGDNICMARPRMKGLPGVRISGTRQTESMNYLFVELDIDEDAKPAVGEISFTKDGRTVGTTPFEMKSRITTQAQHLGVTPHDAIYLVMPDRFACSGRRHEGEGEMREGQDRTAPYGRHGGDLAGLRSHIDYIDDLGMTALWTTPVLANDMDANTYHGYAITDFYNVDPRLGSVEDYKMLASGLHRRGMKLVMDFVVNHCGTRHAWIEDAPSADWFNTWSGDPHMTNYRPSVAHDIHASRYDREHTIRGWFDTTMADLNFANDMVVDYFATCAIWWAETIGIDAIRMDTLPYTDSRGMSSWTSRIRQEYPNLTIVGETWISSSAQLAPWSATKGIVAMDFPLQESVSRAFVEDFSWGCGANRLYDLIANDCALSDPDNLLIFGDNHDTGRLLTTLNNDTEALQMAMVFLATTRGIPQIYYGTEILMQGSGFNGHAHIRQDMPGGWAGDKTNVFASIPSHAKEMHDFVAKLFSYRRETPDLTSAPLIHFIPQNNTYIYFRGEGHMVILNLSDKRQTLYMERFAEICGDTLNGTDILSGRRYKEAKRIYVPRRSALLIRLDPKE